MCSNYCSVRLSLFLAYSELHHVHSAVAPCIFCGSEDALVTHRKQETRESPWNNDEFKTCWMECLQFTWFSGGERNWWEGWWSAEADIDFCNSGDSEGKPVVLRSRRVKLRNKRKCNRPKHWLKVNVILNRESHATFIEEQIVNYCVKRMWQNKILFPYHL